MVGKGKMLVTSIFSFYHSVFYPIKEILHHLNDIEIAVCKCFEFRQGQNFIVL